MFTSIRNISHIQAWYFLKTEPDGVAVYLQAKHFDEYGDIKKDALNADLRHDLQERHLLQENDVIFVGKWVRTFAWAYKSQYGPCVASSAFFIIRIHYEIVLPEYLALLLNKAEYMPDLKKHYSWSTVPSISKHILSDLEIPIPPIEKQKIMIKLAELHKKASSLRSEIQSKQNLLVSHSILLASHL